MASWPALPARAAYLALHNASRRNALSLSILRDLRAQLHKYNTSPLDNKLRLLPPFSPALLPTLEAAASGSSPDPATDAHAWLVDSARWRAERHGLPNVIVLRSSGPVFCAGHDLAELHALGNEEVKETFALCAEVMGLIRRSPAPVVCVVQGLATAAGAQLALTADLPIALAGTLFRLPGASLGLPCTSPSTAVSRRVGAAMTYRMLALAEPVRAEELRGAVDVVAFAGDGDGDGDEHAHGHGHGLEVLEERVREVVARLAEQTAPQPQALGKWAFWTQVGLNGREKGGDGYEEAVEWTGRVMALHVRSEDAREGMASFLEKRKPEWKL
jgi:enoyl-CoA hydratase/carnithine racemase